MSELRTKEPGVDGSQVADRHRRCHGGFLGLAAGRSVVPPRTELFNAVPNLAPSR